MSKQAEIVLEKPPITRTTLALFAGASNDHNPIHVDIDFAKKAGMDDVFAHGMLSMAYLGQLLTSRFAPSRIKTFAVRFGAITHVGDEITCKGRVVRTVKHDDGDLLELELKATNQTGDVKLIGSATVLEES